MSVPETAAFVALISTGQLAGRVHVGTPPTGTEPPYVVVWPTSALDFAEAETGAEVSRDVSHVVHAVAVSATDALLVADWVDERLRPGGWFAYPVVAGRRCDAVRRTEVMPVQVDDKARPLVHFAGQEFAFISRPGGTP